MIRDREGNKVASYPDLEPEDWTQRGELLLRGHFQKWAEL